MSFRCWEREEHFLIEQSILYLQSLLKCSFVMSESLKFGHNGNYVIAHQAFELECLTRAGKSDHLPYPMKVWVSSVQSQGGYVNLLKEIQNKRREI